MRPFEVSPEQERAMAALPPVAKQQPAVPKPGSVDELNRLNANLLLPAESTKGKGFVPNPYRTRTHLGGAFAEPGPRIEAPPPDTRAVQTGGNGWNGYSAREHRPGITEVFSPRGFKEGTRYFTNLIEPGASSEQLEGHVDWARRQPREVSMRGGQRGSAVAALGAGPSRTQMLQDKYNDSPRDRAMAGKSFTIGDSFRPSGYGGLAALAVRGNERRQEMAEREVNNRRDIADRELGLRARREDREDLMTPYEQDWRSAQSENLRAEADWRRRALEGDEFALSMFGRRSDRDRMSEIREKAIYSLYDRLAQTEDETQRKALEDQLNIFMSGGIPALQVTEAVPGEKHFLPEWLGGKPDIKPVPEQRRWVDRRILGQ